MSQPPEKIRSTATAEPGHKHVSLKSSKDILKMTYQEYIKCHGLGETGLGIELVDPSTTVLDHKRQNLQQEV